MRTWDEQPVPPELQQRLLRELARWQLVDRQIKDLENERARRIRTSQDPCADKVRQLLRLRGIGANSAWLYVMEFFGWRRIRNRSQQDPWQNTQGDHRGGCDQREQTAVPIQLPQLLESRNLDERESREYKDRRDGDGRKRGDPRCQKVQERDQEKAPPRS
jgi:transposase